MDNMSNIGDISLDYLNSSDPVELDRGIRDTIMGVELSNLAIGLALVRIKSEGHLKALGYKSMNSYINSLSEESKKDRSSIYGWLVMGRTYNKYKTELEEIGFNGKDGPSKLCLLERALAAGKREEVFDNLLKMPYRDFRDYAKTGRQKPLNPPFFEIRGNAAFLEGEQVITVSKKLGSQRTKMIMDTFYVVGRALERKGHVVAVHLRNAKEARRFRAEAERIRAEMRKS